MSVSLLILAAGMGSRYGGLKQLDAFGPNGELLLEYSIYDAVEAGFDRVVFVIRRSFRSEFVDRVVKKFQKHIEVDYCFQEIDALPPGMTLRGNREKPWGTGHAVLMAKRQIEGPFAVINADDYYGKGAYAAAAEFVRNHPGATWPVEFACVAFPLGATLSDNGSVSRGICEISARGFLKKVTETKNIVKGPNGPQSVSEAGVTEFSPETPASMNFFVFTPRIFGFLESQFGQFLEESGRSLDTEFYLPAAVATMIRRRQARVKVLKADSEWMGVTYPEDRETVAGRLHQMVESGAYPAKLFTV